MTLSFIHWMFEKFYFKLNYKNNLNHLKKHKENLIAIFSGDTEEDKNIACFVSFVSLISILLVVRSDCDQTVSFFSFKCWEGNSVFVTS